MSDDAQNNNTAAAATTPVGGDAVHQLLHGNGTTGSNQPMSTEQRNQRREELLKRQRESREKAQKMAEAARANSPSPATPSTAAASTTPASAVQAVASAPATPVAAAPAAAVADSNAPVRENLVQMAVSFLSSPNVRSAEESKKIQFLEKKGLTAAEIQIAKSRVESGAIAAAPAVAGPVSQAIVQAPQYSSAPPPVPPRTYAATAQPGPIYYPQQQLQAPVDPLAFRRKLIVALLISGGLTALSAVIVKTLIFPMVRGITNARQSLATAQAALLAKLTEKFKNFKKYQLDLQLGSDRTRTRKITKETAETTTKKATVQDEADEKNGTTTTVEKTVSSTTVTTHSTVKQLDAFSQVLDHHAKAMTFEQLKGARAATQDLAEYITNETYAMTSAIAYPTSRYYGYNTAGALASGKVASEALSPVSTLKSEIRSLKGLLLNTRNFPTAQNPGALTPPNLVQQA